MARKTVKNLVANKLKAESKTEAETEQCDGTYEVYVPVVADEDKWQAEMPPELLSWRAYGY